MTDRAFLSTTDIISVTKETLKENGFSEVTSFKLSRIDSRSQCIFEDPYSLVAIVVFETWADLSREWSVAQTSLVELISDNISKEENKSWDCYLVLLTPNTTELSEIEERQSIQYDTGRVRKLIASGEDIRELADVKTALLPLLPITETFSASAQEEVLHRLPVILESNELPRAKIRAVVEAFEMQKSLVETIHNYGDTE